MKKIRNLIRKYIFRFVHRLKYSHIDVKFEGDSVIYTVKEGLPKKKVKDSFYVWIDKSGRVYEEADEDG